MTVARPRTLAEALGALEATPDAHLLAGGTDFMVEVNFGHRRPTDIVALRRVVELQGHEHADGHVTLGAMLTYAEIEADLAEDFPALAAAGRTVGSPQIRNAGTIGGNVGTASPAGDTLPLLVALDAEVDLAGPEGTRTVALDEFITGPKRTDRRPGEIITRVRVPRVTGPQQFLKIGTRNAMVISIACLALVLDLDARRVRCGLGSVGPRPLRPRAAEDFLSGEIDWDGPRAAPGAVRRFAELVAEACTPITDQRGTAEYRRHAAGVLARRAVERSLQP
jgi:CO/xanthine dehydrogenase FAD-binding subunit